MASHRATDPAPTNGQSPAPRATDQEPTIGGLVADASRDVSTLIRQEIALVKSELKVSIKAGGTGLGLFGAAAFLALLAVVLLTLAFVYLIHLTGLDLAFCYLIVFAVYLGVAGALGFLGYKKVQQVRPPERAIHQAQETKQIFNRG